MGIAERDWSSDRHRQGPGNFWPPARRGWHPLVWAILLVAVFVVGIKVDRWLATRSSETNRAPERNRIVIQPPSTVRQGSHPREPQILAPAPAPSARVVSKCVVNGRMTYGNGCAGSSAQTVVVEAGDSQNQAPPGLTAYQRDMLRSADARIARDAAAAQVDIAARQKAYVSNQGECAAIADTIRSLDAMARQPLSGYQQDDIRRQRQALTSRQFALHC